MNDHNQNRHEGYYGTGTGTYGHQVGADERARDEAAWRSRGGAAPTSSGTQGDGMGIVLILGLVAVGAFVLVMKLYLVAMVLAIVMLAACIRYALPADGERPGWLTALIATTVSYLFILGGCVAVTALAQILGDADNRAGWAPALEYVRGIDDPGYYVVFKGLPSFFLPWLVGLGGGVWWLHRKLPMLRVRGGARLLLLAGLLTFFYLIGIGAVTAFYPLSPV